MKKVALILTVSLLAFSCKKEKETVTTSTDSLKIAQDSANVNTPSQSIKVDIFPFPKEVTECSCQFAKNKADFDAEKYIYVDDANENAFAMLDGQRRAMKLISSSSFEDDSESLSKEIETTEYKISIKAKKIKEEPEAMLFEGTMTIEKPSGEKITMPIYGECAC